MTDDPLAFWKAKLAGENTDHFPALVYEGWWRYQGRPLWTYHDAVENSMMAGFFDTKKVVPADDEFRERVFGFAAKDPVSMYQWLHWVTTGHWHDEDRAALAEYDSFEDAFSALCSAAQAYVPLADDPVQVRRAETVLSRLYEEKRRVKDILAAADEWVRLLRAEIKERGGKCRA